MKGFIKKRLKLYLSEVTVTKSEVNKIITDLNNGTTFSNNYFQFVKRPDGVMLRYDLTRNSYKFYTDLVKFAAAIVRFQKRGY